ncbi:MAG: His/Gly/Thr/Pro-type tRNA ligase C-terminal domain-containing protein, partial [Sulfurimonas sp.]
IEQNHDENGCKWTKETAPFAVNILLSNVKDKAQVALGEELYEKLKALRVEVMLDDTKERFGFKMKDAELIGFTYTVIIGKELENGLVQIYDRKTTQNSSVRVDEIYAKLVELLKS